MTFKIIKIQNSQKMWEYEVSKKYACFWISMDWFWTEEEAIEYIDNLTYQKIIKKRH